MNFMWTAKVRNYREFAAYSDHMQDVGPARASYEHELLHRDAISAMIKGFCGVCNQSSSFLLDRYFGFEAADGSVVPNFRERFECQICGLNTRMRGALQFLEQSGATNDSLIYATEQLSPLFAALKRKYVNLVGSEFLRDGTEGGQTNSAGIRHEDGTALTFEDNTFDYLLSFDVLEHIPDYMTALREMARCLRPGGMLIMTVPFSAASEGHIERARIVDGEIVHILPPEYHGDVLNGDGILCYRHFGWQICEELITAGFKESALHFYWSKNLCLFGGWPLLITATK